MVLPAVLPEGTPAVLSTVNDDATVFGGGFTHAALSPMTASCPAGNETSLYRPLPGVGLAAQATGVALLV